VIFNLIHPALYLPREYLRPRFRKYLNSQKQDQQPVFNPPFQPSFYQAGYFPQMGNSDPTALRMHEMLPQRPGEVRGMI
jgi:hypothetical protein